MDVNRETNLVWNEEELLGRGCEGTMVYGGHFGNIPVAVKRILDNNEGLIEREKKVLQNCRHERIVHLYDIIIEKQFLIIVLERCASTLEAYCQGNYNGPMVEASEGLKQMLEGLAYIHQCNYVHRDVKPSNILISYRGNLKIADFGFSKPITGPTFSISNVGRGTIGWMAPELLRAIDEAEISQNFGSTSARASPAIDIFALGCVFYYFLTKGHHPYGNSYSREINILKGKYNLTSRLYSCIKRSNWIEEFFFTELPSKNVYRSLIKHMIDENPKKRPDLKRILSGPLFQLNIPSEELLRNKTKFNTWIKSLKNKFIINKEAKSRGSQFIKKDSRVSPKRTSILSFSWAAPNGTTFEPLQVVDENNLSPTPPLDDQAMDFTHPAPRPKANSVSASEPTNDSITAKSRKNPRIVQRKLVVSEYFDRQGDEERFDPPRHSKSMTNLFSLGATSALSISYSIQSLASSSVSTLGSILFLGPSDDESDSVKL